MFPRLKINLSPASLMSLPGSETLTTDAMFKVAIQSYIPEMFNSVILQTFMFPRTN
jgi:hypothetical protein